MAIDFQQTDTEVGGTLPIPTGALPLNELTIMYKRMEDGGTAGTTDVTITVVKDAGRSSIGFETLVNVPDDASVWTAGTFTVRLRVNSGSNKMKWTEAHACRMNAAGVIQEVIGSNTTINTSLNPSFPPELFSASITVSASPSALQTDRLYIVYGLTNIHKPASKSIIVESSGWITVHWAVAGARTFVVDPVTMSCVLVAPVVGITRTFTVTPVHMQLVLVAPVVSIPRTFTVGSVTMSLTLPAATKLQDARTFTVPPVTMTCTLLAPTVVGGAGVLKIRVGENWVVIGGQS